jgi:hypothetical protein
MRNRLLFSTVIAFACLALLSGCKLTRLSKLSPEELYAYRHSNMSRNQSQREPSIVPKSYVESNRSPRSSGNSDPAPLLLRDNVRTTTDQ